MVSVFSIAVNPRRSLPKHVKSVNHNIGIETQNVEANVATSIPLQVREIYPVNSQKIVINVANNNRFLSMNLQVPFGIA